MYLIKPLCQDCFFDIWPPNEVNQICLTSTPRRCSMCGKSDQLVVDCVKAGEEWPPVGMILQTGLKWRKVSHD